jgi:hypothetical protein
MPCAHPNLLSSQLHQFLQVALLAASAGVCQGVCQLLLALARHVLQS